MSLASWFSLPQFHRVPTLNKEGRRPSCWQPMHSRPSLEYLEERTLLNASFDAAGGAFNNLNLNSNFNFASSGNVLPMPGYDNAGSSILANGANPQHALNFSGLASGGSGAQAASSAFLAQDQLYSQFRAFGINSEGDGFQLGQRTTANILRDAYGFGSGTMPNAPWKPNAYNLGLANHQFNYSSQSDMGFSPVAPWHQRVAQTVPKEEQNPSPKKDEEATEAPEQLADHHSLYEHHRSLYEQDQSSQERLDKYISDKNEDMKALLDQLAAEKQAPTETAVPEDGSIPDSLWLSALAPAPMAALVAGLPGMAAAAEGGDSGAESGDAAAGPE